MAMTPGETIRKQCVECCGGVVSEIPTCDASKTCVFHKYRMGRGRPSVKLMRKFCLDCMCGSYEAVKDCTTPTCIVYPYRFGRAVNRGEMTEERKEKLATTLSISRTRTQQPILRTRSKNNA